MKDEILSTRSPLGDPIYFYKNIWEGKNPGKSLSIVAGLQGDSLNGVWVAAKLSRFMREITEGRETGYQLTGSVQIFPVVNIRAVESASQSWSFDNLNMDMAFPGNESGDLNEKLSGALMRHTSDSTYGLILQTGGEHYDDYPHLKLFSSSRHKRRLAGYFNLAIGRTVQNIPPRNLHLASHWEDNGVQAFLISAGRAKSVDHHICDLIFEGIVNFMLEAGLLTHSAIKSRKSDIRFYDPESELILPAPESGLFKAEVDVGRQLKEGQTLGHMVEIYSGDTIAQVIAPENSRLVSLLHHPLVYKQEPLAVILTEKKRRWLWSFL